MDSQENQSAGSSRRSFLKKMPLGLAGVLALTTIGGSLFKRGRNRRTKVEFAKDSIFRPRDGGPRGA
jgi:hypothetical protein